MSFSWSHRTLKFPALAFFLTGAALAKPAIDEARFSLTLVVAAIATATAVALFVLGFFLESARRAWGWSFSAGNISVFAVSMYFQQFCPLWVVTHGSAEVRVTTEAGGTQKRNAGRDLLSSEDFDADFAEFRIRKPEPGTTIVVSVVAAGSAPFTGTYVLPQNHGYSAGLVIVPNGESSGKQVFLQVAKYADTAAAGSNVIVPLESWGDLYVLPREPSRILQEIPRALTFMPVGSKDEQDFVAIRLLARPSPRDGRLREESNFRPML